MNKTNLITHELIDEDTYDTNNTMKSKEKQSSYLETMNNFLHFHNINVNSDRNEKEKITKTMKSTELTKKKETTKTTKTTKTSEFDLTKLNDRQRTFVETDIHLNGKLLGIPGGGKTTCVIERIKYNLHYHKLQSAHSFFVVTFSRHAAHDFRKKASHKSFNMTNVLTIHSLAGKILNTIRKKKKSSSRIQSMDTVVYRATEELTKYCNNEEKCEELFSLLPKLRNLKHICIDESQDISNTQYKFACILAKVCYASLVLVGDPNQNIFGFQNGSSRYLLEHTGFITQLIQNYRSVSNIIEIINHTLPMNLHNNELIESGQKQEVLPNNSFLSFVNTISPEIWNSPKLIEGDLHEICDLILSVAIQFILEENSNKTLAIIGPVKNSKNMSGKYLSIGLNTIANALDTLNIPFEKKYSDKKNNDDNVNNDFQDKNSKTNENMKENKIKNNNKIILTTIHSSKGLEYDIVFLLNYHYYTQNCLPKQTDLHFLRCLWYVGLSRAKYHCFVFKLKDRMVWPGYKTLQEAHILPSIAIETNYEVTNHIIEKNEYKNYSTDFLHSYLTTIRINCMNYKYIALIIPEVNKVDLFQSRFAYVADILNCKNRLNEEKMSILEDIVCTAFYETGKQEYIGQENQEEEAEIEIEKEEKEEEEEEEEEEYFNPAYIIKNYNTSDQKKSTDIQIENEVTGNEKNDKSDTIPRFFILPSYKDLAMLYGLWTEDTITHAYRGKYSCQLQKLLSMLMNSTVIPSHLIAIGSEMLRIMNMSNNFLSYKQYISHMIPLYQNISFQNDHNGHQKKSDLKKLLTFFDEQFQQLFEQKHIEKIEDKEEQVLFCYFEHVDKWFDFSILHEFVTKLTEKCDQQESLSILDLFLLNLFHYQFENCRRTLWFRHTETFLSELYDRYAFMEIILYEYDQIIRNYAKNLEDGYKFQVPVKNPFLNIYGCIDAYNEKTKKIVEFKFTSQMTKDYLLKCSDHHKIIQETAFQNLNEVYQDGMFSNPMTYEHKMIEPKTKDQIQVFGYAEFLLCKNDCRNDYTFSVVYLSEIIQEVSGSLKNVKNEDRFVFHDTLRTCISDNPTFSNMFVAYDFETTGLIFNNIIPKILEYHFEEIHSNLIVMSGFVTISDDFTYDENFIERLTKITREMCNTFGITENTFISQAKQFIESLDITCALIAHNGAQFDHKILRHYVNNFLNNKGGVDSYCQMLDSLHLFPHFIEDCEELKNKWISSKNSSKKLQAIYDVVTNKQLIQTHRASDDTKMILEIARILFPNDLLQLTLRENS